MTSRKPARREHERIAAADDHLPDLRLRRDIVESDGERFRRSTARLPGPTISRRKQKRQ